MCIPIPNSVFYSHSHGIPMGMEIKHRIGNGNGREWETTSVGMGITCTPMGIYSQRFYAAMSLLCSAGYAQHNQS